MTNRKKALILLNTAAGMGKAENYSLEISRRFAEEGYEPLIYPIIPGTDLVSEKLLAEYDGEVEMVLCSGGDGTLNHTMRGIMEMQKPPRIAYIPAGSTNDFATGLGISSSFDEALETALHGRLFRYDAGCLNDCYFNYVAAFGAFSALSYATNQKLKNIMGHAAYIVSAMSDLRNNMRYNCHMRIETDQGREEGDYIFGAVCNSASIGGFEMFRDTEVDLDDGRMELLLIKAPANPVELQKILNSLRKGEMHSDHISLRQIRNAHIVSDSNTAWTIDGEFGGSYEEVDIEVLRRVVPIMM